MRADILAAALDSLERNDRPLICLSPRGRPLDQARVRQLAGGPGLIAIAGRFEGFDQRLIEAREIEEISLGDYVLAGGEVAAMALIEACVRLLPGVLGSAFSLAEESFETGLLEYPQYTRPKVFEGLEIPPVLVSGDHRKVAAWRRERAEELTRTRRPDLWKRYCENGPLRRGKNEG
jgi:tRNA (guanine37-N1)-methyltransferase